MHTRKRRKNLKTKHDPDIAIARSVALLRPKSKKEHAKSEARIKKLKLRDFQKRIFRDNKTGILILHWSRQIGKSYVLAAWAVQRLMDRPGRLITVLSNSRENGGEFLRKAEEICKMYEKPCEAVDESLTLHYEAMRMELRIFDKGKIGRIKVLAANPRTARGFSGDLILDEFAFHEDSAAIWEAAEPILASNPDFLCRIASTGNGRHNLFYRMVEGQRLMEEGLMVDGGDRLKAGHRAGMGSAPASGAADGALAVGTETGDEMKRGIDAAIPLIPAFSPSGGEGDRSITEKSMRPDDGCALEVRREGAPNCARGGRGPLGMDADEFYTSSAGFRVSRISRTVAYKQGAKIFDPMSRKEITPEVARGRALDKRAYDQNYECAFEGGNFTLLSHELISAAEVEGVGEICEQAWNVATLQRLNGCNAPLFAGFDVARKTDLSVITVVERIEGMFFVRAILRMRNIDLPEQKNRLGEICRLPQFRRAAIDMTGLGLGLFEFAAKEFGTGRIQGVNFASVVPVTVAAQREGARRESVRVTEALALELLQAYEDRRIKQPVDLLLRDDLRKPERMVTPGGRVSIAATRDEAGHADHFWSLALALEAASGVAERPVAMETFRVESRWWERRTALM